MNYVAYKQIDGTITSGFKVKDVQFVNHNNRTAARSYIDLCNKLSKAFRDKYTDKHYIKDNWFTDKFIINDITADTIAKGIGQYITNTDSDRYSVSAIMWLSDISVFLFIRITIVTRKLDRLIRDINDTQNWIRKIQIDICDINKQWEVKRDRDRNRLDRIEDRIGKLASDFNDIIRKKV